MPSASRYSDNVPLVDTRPHTHVRVELSLSRSTVLVQMLRFLLALLVSVVNCEWVVTALVCCPESPGAVLRHGGPHLERGVSTEHFSVHSTHTRGAYLNVFVL